MRPISCPLNDFVRPAENSVKLHPLGARKRSSFNIAKAFARSKNPSKIVHKPIFCKRCQRFDRCRLRELGLYLLQLLQKMGLWTILEVHGKDMTQDSTFEFERKRNRPERYDRSIAENTLKAIKKIAKIRSDRSSDHIKNRLKTGKIQRQKEARKQLEQDIHLVKAPLALAQDSSLRLPKIKVNVSQTQTEENQQMEE